MTQLEGRHEVRITRSGNTRALPIPAAIAHAVGLEQGDRFELQVVGEMLLYRRRDDVNVVSHEGIGNDRVFMSQRGRAVFLDSTQGGVGLIDDWTF